MGVRPLTLTGLLQQVVVGIINAVRFILIFSFPPSGKLKRGVHDDPDASSEEEDHPTREAQLAKKGRSSSKKHETTSTGSSDEG